MRFVTAPIRSRKPLSCTYSTESGAVTNRTYLVGAKRLQTAPTGLGTAKLTPMGRAQRNPTRAFPYRVPLRSTRRTIETLSNTHQLTILKTK